MRLQNTFFLTSLVGSVLLVGTLFVLMQWSADRGMLAYLNTREAERWQVTADVLADYYAEQGDWLEFEESPRRFGRLIDGPMREEFGGGPPGGPGFRDSPPGRPPHKHDKRDRRDGRRAPPPGGPLPPVALLTPGGSIIAGTKRPELNYAELTILHEGDTVGLLAYPLKDQVDEGYELSFLQQQREFLLLISAALLLFAAATSLPLAKRLVRPLEELTTASHRLAKGDYSKPTDIQRRDELGDLARDFNQLRQTLEQNEGARKRWLADTSHELRTPIAIVRAELEAMLDGVRPMERESIVSALQEVLHLAKLVDDLHELANADIGGMRYRMETMDLNELVSDTAQQFQQVMDHNALTFTVAIPDAPSNIHGDETRLAQLLTNLLNNSCKYTDAGGTVRLALESGRDHYTVSVSDSAPGVPEDALAHLFDHLYRVEDSRNRKTGGSGLGLAICRRIAEAHNSTLSAEHAAEGGVRVELRIPRGT